LLVPERQAHLEVTDGLLPSRVDEAHRLQLVSITTVVNETTASLTDWDLGWFGSNQYASFAGDVRELVRGMTIAKTIELKVRVSGPEYVFDVDEEAHDAFEALAELCGSLNPTAEYHANALSGMDTGA